MGLNFKVIEPKEKPQNMIVVLHGMGSNKEDMSELAEKLAQMVPNSLILIPEGPIKFSLNEKTVQQEKGKNPDLAADNHRSWFEMNLIKLPLRLLFNRLAVLSELNTLIDEQLKKYDLVNEDLAFFGFSQGGGMALYAAIKRNGPCAAVVCHSAPFFGMTSAHSQPKTMMLIGEQDIESVNKAILPVRLLFSHDRSIKRLKNRHIPVESVIIKELGHSCTQDTIEKSAAFIKKAFADKKHHAPHPPLQK